MLKRFINSLRQLKAANRCFQNPVGEDIRAELIDYT